MIVEPELTIDERVAACRAKLSRLSVADWTNAMGESRYLSERQVLYTLLALVAKEPHRDINPVAERCVKIVEDRLALVR